MWQPETREERRQKLRDQYNAARGGKHATPVNGFYAVHNMRERLAYLKEWKAMLERMNVSGDPKRLREIDVLERVLSDIADEKQRTTNGFDSFVIGRGRGKNAERRQRRRAIQLAYQRVIVRWQTPEYRTRRLAQAVS